MSILGIVIDADFETKVLLVLQRIAGALECLCEAWGVDAKPPTSKPPSGRKGKEKNQ